MDARATIEAYASPQIADYGDLREVTRSSHLMLGSALDPSGTASQDLSFSGAVAPSSAVLGSSDSGSGASPSSGDDASGVAGTGASGGGGAGAGGGGGGGSGAGGGSGSLPFTGLAVGVVGAAGAAMAAGGAALRRLARRG
jgi:hypothetical protein